MSYTVVMTYYNQSDRIKGIVDSWNNQTLPPEKIIILDDGSDERLVMDDVTVLNLPHSGNVSKNINIGYEMVDTDYMIVTSADLFCNPNFSKQSIDILKGLPPMSMPVGQYIMTDLLDPKQEKNANPKTYGRITRFPVNGKIVQNPVAEGWMRRTDEYLYNCEEYTGWGYEDTDYKFRFQLAGGKYYGYDFLKLFHLNHPNKRGWKKGSNKELFFSNVKYYKENNITKLK